MSGFPRAFATVLVFLLSFNAWAKIAPEFGWETFETDHFRIRSPRSYRVFAIRVSQELERAYGILTKYLSWKLERRAEVVIRGDTDVANGLASVFPYNRIVFHPIPFSAGTPTGEYDDWIRTLVVHELTHLLANDTTAGIFDLGRTVFGSAAKMNPYQPQWLVEGLAVFTETNFGLGGRGRSAFNDMVIRTAVREGLLENRASLLGVTLDRLNDGIPFWPGPLAPYLYGYVMQQAMANHRGSQAPAEVSARNASRLPFFLNSVASEVLKANYYDLWSQAVVRLRTLARQDLEALGDQPLTSVKRMTKVGRMTGAPVSSHDGKRIYFIRDSYRSGTGISVLDAKSGESEPVSDWRYGGARRLRLDVSGRWLGYSRIEPYRQYRSYSDVFVWDLEENEEVQLTHGARASEPDFSPDFLLADGRLSRGEVVYVKNLDDGNQALVAFNGKSEREIHRGRHFERLSSPAWGRGGRAEWIVFALKPLNQGERLMAIHVKTGQLKTLTRSFERNRHAAVLSPSWTSTGALLYASAQKGVYNLYRIPWDSHATPRPERITHLETGALDPVEWSGHSEILAAVYGASGFEISQVQVPGEGHRVRAPLRQLKPLHQKLAKNGGRNGLMDVSSTETSKPPITGSKANSSPFPALLPKYWLPSVRHVADGWNFGVTTSGDDPLERHEYRIDAAWDTRASFPLYQVFYKYDGLYPSIELSRQQFNQYIGLEKQSNRITSTGLVLDYPMGLAGVGFGARLNRSEFFDESSSSGGLQARFHFGNPWIYPDSIDQSSGESGTRFELLLTGFLSGPEQFSSTEVRLDQRVPSFFDRHFFRLFAAAAHSSNQQISALYHVGGGEVHLTEGQGYLVRGYQPGTIYGRELVTLNLEYWMPFMDVFRGHGTLPGFYERSKLKFFVDTGAGEFLNGVHNDFKNWPVGVGVHFLHDLKIFYRFPMSLGVGLDWGLNEAFGGQKQIVFGFYHRLR